MVFTILRGCLPYSNDWNILECKWSYGTCGSNFILCSRMNRKPYSQIHTPTYINHWATHVKVIHRWWTLLFQLLKRDNLWIIKTICLCLRGWTLCHLCTYIHDTYILTYKLGWRCFMDDEALICTFIDDSINVNWCTLRCIHLQDWINRSIKHIMHKNY